MFRNYVNVTHQNYAYLPLWLSSAIGHFELKIFFFCASTTCQGSSHVDTNETNIQLKAVGCSLSNTSCDGEVLDEIEGSFKNKTQVLGASLVVGGNPSETKSSMFEVSFLRESSSTSAMVTH